MKKKLTVALDVDDVLALCGPYALERWRNETGESITQYQVTGWVGAEAGWTKYFADPEFVASQPVIPGAKEFVHELIRRGCDIMVITAVPLHVASVRAGWLAKNFPEIKQENIILGRRKDVCTVDILVDDGAHNILSSPARFPILMRKPWNQHVTGVLAANNFDDCLNLIDTIMRQNGFTEDVVPADVVCLVGPSGSGKTEIIDKLIEEGWRVPRIFTTSASANKPYYKKISKAEFEDNHSENFYAETTSYAGEYYGIRLDDMVGYMSKRTAPMVIPTDVCGANALMRIYGNCVKTVYIKRDRPALVAGILAKQMSDEEKAMRILALDGEERNEDLCDYSIRFDDVANVVQKIKQI